MFKTLPASYNKIIKYILIASSVFLLMIYMVSPSFANSDLTYWLDGYLLKSGIIPNDFPFRAKMVNNFILFASPILSFIISLIVLTKSTDEESIRNLIQNGGKGFFI